MSMEALWSRRRALSLRESCNISGSARHKCQRGSSASSKTRVLELFLVFAVDVKAEPSTPAPPKRGGTGLCAPHQASVINPRQ